MTGPIVPTVTSASGTFGSSIARNSSRSGAFACSTLMCSTLPTGTWSTRKRNALDRVRTRPAGLDRAVEHADDRLDRQHRAQHRLRAADAAALAQVLERVERGEHVLALAAGVDLADDLLERRAGAGAPGRVEDEVADAHRRAEASR